ncbi:unnamed protein product [Anisakis simplex]|uniref:Uncharacterized protein n=1 Tax=Anisakis simplex TaxID=6269 RepID=A0A0M3J209_ANISI|nr:unnamed protein product [Anisakis simplex]
MTFEYLFCGLQANEPTVPSATGTDVWTNYVENGRVRFDRLHSVNAVLAFERNAAGAAEPMELPLISKKELFEKLKQKNEQRNQIELDKQKLPENQQIGHFGQETKVDMVELPDSNEGDYKEMVSSFAFWMV